MASHPVHHPDAAYGPPEVHVPYPAEHVNYPPYLNIAEDDPDRESLTGEMRGDETAPEVWAQAEIVFNSLVLEGIGIGSTKYYGTKEEQPSVLLQIPRTAAEENELFEKCMKSLRAKVAALEEEELFESSMKNFTQRSSAVTETNGGMVTVAANPPGVVGESNAAGLGEQPRTVDVRELLKADTRETWARERDRRTREV